MSLALSRAICRNHFVQCLSVHLSVSLVVTLSDIHTLVVVKLNLVYQIGWFGCFED